MYVYVLLVTKNIPISNEVIIVQLLELMEPSLHKVGMYVCIALFSNEVQIFVITGFTPVPFGSFYICRLHAVDSIKAASRWNHALVA